MSCTRRDLALLLPALSAAAPAQNSNLPSKTFRFEDLSVKENGPNQSRAIMNGLTHSGYAIEIHQTTLGPGQAPHPPHHHVHEEMVLVIEGSIEFTVNGATTKLGPGSVAYAASNDEHGQRNAGNTPARYFVIALGRDS